MRLAHNVDITSKYRGLDLCYFGNPIDGFYLMEMHADTWWRELKFERRQRQHLLGLRIVGWQSLEMFALPSSKRNDFYSPVSHCWDHKSICVYGVLTAVTFSLPYVLYEDLLTDLSHGGKRNGSDNTWCGSTHGSYGVVKRLRVENLTFIGDIDRVLTFVSQSMIRQWCSMGIFRVLGCMRFNQITVLLAIARFTDVH